VSGKIKNKNQQTNDLATIFNIIVIKLTKVKYEVRPAENPLNL
jgi:hypothetical protein